MCAAVLTVLLPDFNIGNFITGVLRGRTRAYCSIVHIVQTGPPGRIFITGQGPDNMIEGQRGLIVQRLGSRKPVCTSQLVWRNFRFREPRIRSTTF